MVIPLWSGTVVLYTGARMRKVLLLLVLLTSCDQVSEEPACLKEECVEYFELVELPEYRVVEAKDPPNYYSIPDDYQPLGPWCSLQRQQVCAELEALSEAGYIDENKVWYLCTGPGRYRFKCRD